MNLGRLPQIENQENVMKKKISILFFVSMIGTWVSMPLGASENAVRGHYKNFNEHAVPLHSGRRNIQSYHSWRHFDDDREYWVHERRYYRKHLRRHYKHHSHHRDRRVFLRQDRHHDDHESGVKIGIYYKGYL